MYINLRVVWTESTDAAAADESYYKPRAGREGGGPKRAA